MRVDHGLKYVEILIAYLFIHLLTYLVSYLVI